MRALLTLAIWLACWAVAGATPAIVQAGPALPGYAAGSPLSITSSLGSTSSASNLVVLVCFSNAGGSGGQFTPNTSTSIATPSGMTAGPTYNATTVTAQTPLTVSIFYRTGLAATTMPAVSITTVGGSAVEGLVIPLEISGANNASPTNGSAFNQQTIAIAGLPAAITGPSVTPSVANTLALGGHIWNDDSQYNGPDIPPAGQHAGWTEPFAPQFLKADGTNNGYVTGVEMAYIASPTSGVAINPTNTMTTFNSQAAHVVPVSFLWVIAPATAPAPSSKVFPYPYPSHFRPAYMPQGDPVFEMLVTA
jgi:hypothetical protein